MLLDWERILNSGLESKPLLRFVFLTCLDQKSLTFPPTPLAACFHTLYEGQEINVLFIS